MAEITYVSRPATIREMLLIRSIADPSVDRIARLALIVTFLHLRTDKQVPESVFLDMEQDQFDEEVGRCIRDCQAGMELASYIATQKRGQ